MSVQQAVKSQFNSGSATDPPASITAREMTADTAGGMKMLKHSGRLL